MSISAAGIIFSSLNNNTLSRLTSDRTVAAIPFACRYRLVDFCLSNLVNANISNIYIVANYGYRSLLEHIGSGKDWDLARRDGGITFISPFQTAHSSLSSVFTTHMEALINMREYINEIKEDYVVLMDSDHILNIDIEDVIKKHEETEANITFVTQRISVDYTSKTPRMMISSVLGKIVDIAMASKFNPNNTELSLNIFVMKTTYLNKMIGEAKAYSQKSFTEILLRSFKMADYRTYCYNGFVASVSSFLDYYRYSMALCKDEEARFSLLFKKEKPIYTKVHNSYPTIYGEKSSAESSLIADECVIEGEVYNSVLFRGVHVMKGAVVKNSILFQGTYVGKNASLNCIVTDKNVQISESVKLSGNENIPFYVQKGRRV